MAFKGGVRVGAQITVSLRLDSTADGSAFHFMAYGRSGGTPSEESEEVAPGGFGVLSMFMDSPGRLRIVVDLTSETDTGDLQVTEDDVVRDAETITGDTAWTYAVVQAEDDGE